MKKLPTLTIGIPACNEEKNIGNLIESIFSQTSKNYKLVEVIIISDGSTDKTIKIIKGYKSKFHKIKLIERKTRSGKANALNELYRTTNSDLLLTMDADVLFVGVTNLDLMTQEIMKDSRLNMVGPLHEPTISKTFFGNLSRFSYLTVRDASLRIDDGNNFYNVMSCEFMKKRFYKSYLFPKGTVSDQCYAYAMSIKNGKGGFRLVKNAIVVFGIAQTFNDWRVLSARSVVGDKADLVKHFGKAVLKDYTMPKKLLVTSLFLYFFKNPIYLAGSVLMNIYIRKYPYKTGVPKNGMWTMVTTSKEIAI